MTAGWIRDQIDSWVADFFAGDEGRRVDPALGPFAEALVTQFLLLLFLLLHSVSAIVMLRAGHARLVLNALWLWVSFGGLFFAVRQLARSGVQQRAVCSVVLALAAGLAALGFYQVGYSNPKLRADFAKNPDPGTSRLNR